MPELNFAPFEYACPGEPPVRGYLHTPARPSHDAPHSHARRRCQLPRASARRCRKRLLRVRRSPSPLRSAFPPTASARPAAARQRRTRPARPAPSRRSDQGSSSRPRLPRRPFLWRTASLDSRRFRSHARRRAAPAFLSLASAESARAIAHRSLPGSAHARAVRPRRARRLRHHRRIDRRAKTNSRTHAAAADRSRRPRTSHPAQPRVTCLSRSSPRSPRSLCSRRGTAGTPQEGIATAQPLPANNVRGNRPAHAA